MGGDYSRRSFDPLRDFSGVGMQQGHLTTDADWNELVAILERRIRTGTLDTVGRAVVPEETPTGFEIRLAPGPGLSIGRGRMYVDGFLAENHGGIGTGPARPVLDRARLEPDGEQTGVLDEMISTQANDFVDYAAQPYLPRPPALPATPGPHIAYLDVWQREVTAVHDPRLLDPALGGADTATRWQTVWQVRLLEDVGAGATCGSQSAKWDALIAPSPARLTTDTMVVEDPEDPCIIPPGGGYRGLENHFYRVEIHTGGAPGAARFKWSRDDSSVASRIISFEPGNRVRVRSLGPDSTRQFAVGDWVEITDDHREYNGQSGDMRRIVAIGGTDEIELSAALSPDLAPASPDSTDARATRIVRWDGKGKVRLDDGSLHIDLDATADGLIPVPAGGKAVQLEAGITIAFTTEPAGGTIRALDHWTFWARTEGAQIEILDAEPPAIQHHYARLAVLTFPSTVSDCRIFWPPAEECGCTVCVSAEGHNSGRYTIQDAVADLPAAGGTICLGPGDFILGETPVLIADRQSVRLRGHGFGSELAYAGAGGALRLRNVNDLRVTDLAVTVASAFLGPTAIDRFESSAIDVVNGIEVTVARTRLKVASGEGGNDYGISSEGVALNFTIEDNWIDAVTGIGFRGAARPAPANQTLFSLVYNLRIADNLILSPGAGILLDGFVFHFGPVHVAANAIFAGRTGVSTSGIGLGVPSGGNGVAADNWSATGVWIQDNMISFARGGTGIASGILDLRVLNNDIFARSDSIGDGPGSCVRLVQGGMPLVPADAQIVGNRLGDVDGYGLSIEAPQASLIVKQNVIRDCAQGAVTMGPNASIRSLSLDNNLIERVATQESAELRSAVRLSGVEDARIIGNSVRGVGAAFAGAVKCVGFDINGAGRLDVSHNLIADIGPGIQDADSIGIFVRGAVTACTITDNEIYDRSSPTGQPVGHWCGIYILGHSNFGQPFITNFAASLPGFATSITTGTATVATGTATTNAAARTAAGTAIDPATGAIIGAATPTAAATAGPSPMAPAATTFFVSGESVFALGTGRIWFFGPAMEAEIRISGNVIDDKHLASSRALVQVEGSASSCIFTDNHCILRTAGRNTTPSVLVMGQRVVASNNIVRRQFVQGRGLAMSLWCGSFSPIPTAPAVPMVTVIGNIVGGGITVNGAPPPNQFTLLNVQSN
jgi:hypothetical protein